MVADHSLGNVICNNAKTQKTIATTSSNVPALTASTNQNIVTPESKKVLR